MISHYQVVPFNLQSGWLPPPSAESAKTFVQKIQKKPKSDLDPTIQALQKVIEDNPVLKELADQAFKENAIIIAAHQETAEAPIPLIVDLDQLLHMFNGVMDEAPQFINNELVGLPFSAITVGIDPTLAGSTLFRLNEFNKKMADVLKKWGKFLEGPASNTGFRVEGAGWLSPTAKKQYKFEDWKKDSPTLPYWTSWDSFFTREFKDKAKQRPIAGPDTNQVVISPNDGSLFCWERQVKKKDIFWLKGMPYSLDDIFSSPCSEQNKRIQDCKIDGKSLSDVFEGGYVFQTYLNPYNFHRWWVPVNGTVAFEPEVIPGCFFAKLVLPDYGGATTASTPFLAEVNARGLIVFETHDYGYVACLPLGMSEVSSVGFDKSMKKGATVQKGDEMGSFHYGGSSFVVIYQHLPDKQLVFQNDKGMYYPQQPPPPGSSAGASNYPTWIGSQIGQWYSK